jgi:hypothetical protein
VPVIQMSILVAPPSTPLYARLKEQGRLVADDWVGAADFLASNIRPKLMSEAQRSAGVRWLMNRIYTPQAYGCRVRKFVDASRVRTPARRSSLLTGLEGSLARRLMRYGPSERTLVELLEGFAWTRPDLHVHLSYFLLYYCQVRYLLESFDLWDPGIARQDVAFAS